MAEMNNDEKLNRFAQDVLAEAEAKRRNILDGLDARRGELINSGQDKILGELYADIRGQIAQIKKEAGLRLSHDSMVVKQDYLVRRAQITEKLREAARTALGKYTRTQEYRGSLASVIDSGCSYIASHYGVSDAPTDIVAEVSPADADYAASLPRERSYTAGDGTTRAVRLRIAADKSIKLGGVRLREPVTGVILDQLLETRLEDALGGMKLDEGN